MTILRMSSIFAESANRLPKQTKAKLPKVFMLLTSNPRLISFTWEHTTRRLVSVHTCVSPVLTTVQVCPSWSV
jgi:hypothetical protein